MRRRALLRGVCLGGVTALAGCLSSEGSGLEEPPADETDGGETDRGTETKPDSGASTETDTMTDTNDTADGADETVTETDGGSPSVAGTEFTVESQGSGTQRDDATVTFCASAVEVAGTIWGTDGCKTATLAGVDYDAAAAELTVAVATTDREGAGEMCTQAIVEIDYRAEVSFDGGLPSTVVVTHDRGKGPSEVARASQSG